MLSLFTHKMARVSYPGQISPWLSQRKASVQLKLHYKPPSWSDHWGKAEVRKLVAEMEKLLYGKKTALVPCLMYEVYLLVTGAVAPMDGRPLANIPRGDLLERLGGNTT